LIRVKLNEGGDCTLAASFSEESRMYSALRIALLSLLLCVPAQAQEIQVGSMLACDTQQQVERFVAAYHGDVDSATKAVNAEERDPTACDMVMVAYVRGPEVSIVRSDNRTFHIVRILVLGVVTAEGMLPAAPTAFFSILQVDEQEA
jgi:hypothetical protein